MTMEEPRIPMRWRIYPKTGARILQIWVEDLGGWHEVPESIWDPTEADPEDDA